MVAWASGLGGGCIRRLKYLFVSIPDENIFTIIFKLKIKLSLV